MPNDDSKLAAEDMAGALRVSKASKWHIDKDWATRDAHREKLVASLESGEKVIVPKALLDALEMVVKQAKVLLDPMEHGVDCDHDEPCEKDFALEALAQLEMARKVP